ncbi:MAG: phage minor head protein [Xanthobacteraceae bacterium]
MASNRFDQLIDAWEPQLRKAFLDAVYAMRGRADIAQITAMLERRDVEGALKAVGLDPASFRLLDRGIVNAFEAGALATETIIPVLRGADGFRTVFQFNIRNPAAETWLRTYSSTLVRDIVDDQRAMIRSYLQSGLAQGANPRTTAHDLVGRINKATGKREGGVIGLTSTQEQWLRNYEAELSSENPLSALNRKLRDARFDASVRKAAESGKPIPEALKAKMVTAYRNRALRLRAESIARSETITSLHTAQDQAIEQAIASGAIDREAVTFKWRSAKDKRVREAHRNLDGETAKYGEAFQSDLGPIRYPGDPQAVAANRINCRCWREPAVDFLRGVK